MVKCNTCFEDKYIEEFAVNKLMKNGHKNRCKACERKLELARRELKIDEIRAKDKERSKSPERVAHVTKTTKEWRKANPERYKAQNKLNNAVRSGKVLKTACMECGEPKVEGHHPDYSNPLSVVWLCHEHHMQLHKEFNA